MKILVATALSALLLTHAAWAASPVERIRGTIETIEPDAMVVRTIDGTSETIRITSDTKVISVVKSSLDAVKGGVFVGTATKGDNPPTALEIHIFPESMRGTGEGHRDWDTIPDTLAGSGRTKSAMTNGTVKIGSPLGPRVKSATTNGTVASSTSPTGERMLTLSYDKGQSLTIAVSPQTPIVTYEPADKSILRSGAKVFVTSERDGGKLTAVRIGVGKDGLTPSM